MYIARTCARATTFSRCEIEWRFLSDVRDEYNNGESRGESNVDEKPFPSRRMYMYMLCKGIESAVLLEPKNFQARRELWRLSVESRTKYVHEILELVLLLKRLAFGLSWNSNTSLCIEPTMYASSIIPVNRSFSSKFLRQDKKK